MKVKSENEVAQSRSSLFIITKHWNQHNVPQLNMIFIKRDTTKKYSTDSKVNNIAGY